MNQWYRIFGVVLFLSLYISAITPIHFPAIQATQSAGSAFQKKQSSVVSNITVSSSIEVVSENVSNAQNSGLKNFVGDNLLNFKALVFKTKSTFKQYSVHWHNLLIASRKTDQLYPHHTYG